MRVTTNKFHDAILTSSQHIYEGNQTISTKENLLSSLLTSQRILPGQICSALIHVFRRLRFPVDTTS